MLYTVSWPPDMQENLAGQRVTGAKTEGIARVTSALGDEKVLSVHEIWRPSRMLSIGITAWQGRSLIVVFLLFEERKGDSVRCQSANFAPRIKAKSEQQTTKIHIMILWFSRPSYRLVIRIPTMYIPKARSLAIVGEQIS